MPTAHTAWSSSEHVTHFDALSRLPEWVLRQSYERFNEVQLLNEQLARRPGPLTLLEVGCATGEFSRYLHHRHPRLTYTGCDISRPALARAVEKYPDTSFVETDSTLSTFVSARFDIVFCRDVVHHQPNPMAFMQRLYAMANWLVVLRIRTRERGRTVHDPADSCQLIYGQWMPYIIMQSKELMEALPTLMLSPTPASIQLVKSPMVLGGQAARYVPKDCYQTETGTAESALVLEKSSTAATCLLSEEIQYEARHLSLIPRAVAWLSR